MYHNNYAFSNTICIFTVQIVSLYCQSPGEMIQRTIYSELERSIGLKQVVVITGLRRIGKTTALMHLSDKIASTNKLFFDLEKVENRVLFNSESYDGIIKSLSTLGIDFSQKAYLFIDEIQLVPNIPSVIKYIYDHFDVKFFVTGSSSYYIKNLFSESLAGRKRIIHMEPFSFSEFLEAKGVKAVIKLGVWEHVLPPIYLKLRDYYAEYVEFGGFPEVVLSDSDKEKTELLRDILNSYLHIDIKFLSDFKKKEEIYKLIALLTSRVGNKIDYSKISILAGINRNLVKEYLQFFEDTFLIRQMPAYVQNKDREIALQKKLYFTDNGFVRILGGVGSGALFENAICNQLIRRGELKYYATKTGQEINFIINDSVAVEVKETPTDQDVSILNHRAEKLNLKEKYVVGKNIPGSGFKEFVWGGSI